MDPRMAAGGAPPMAGGGQPQVAPGAAPQGGNPEQLMQVLEAAIQQAVDENGYVDLKKLVEIWPQVAQQAGVNVPFETVMQMVQQNPEILNDLIARLGLAGVIVDGQVISAEQLSGMGTGAV